MSVDVKLTNNQMDALLECARYVHRRQDYWWREASMKRLAEHGLVEDCDPVYAMNNGYRGKQRAYRVTKLGWDFLAAVSQPSA